ncbi:MAG: hypothetical protein JJU11_04605 [Candidatus Sumerlaeia bacterium]|nr:hypothetical protein [Candidatus Sumerlaeia bacterium]
MKSNIRIAAALMAAGVFFAPSASMLAASEYPMKSLAGTTGGFFDNWAVIGPFPSPVVVDEDTAGIRRAGWDVDFLQEIGGETGARFQIDDIITLTVNGGERVYTIQDGIAGAEGHVNLRWVLDARREAGTNKLAYAYHSVEVEEPGTYHFLLGADDAAKLYVGGKLVHSQWFEGRAVTRADFHLPVELDAGVHDVLIKVENGTGPWGFALEVHNEEGYQAYLNYVQQGPPGFPSFSFEGHEEDSRTLTEYLWYHFHHRIGNFHTLFFREYMTVSDIWMANAPAKGKDISMQEEIRSWYEDTVMDADGYIQSHQHFSHAHDGGWPFPLWPQVVPAFTDVTYGWHFQEDHGPGWVWAYNMIHPDTPATGTKAAESWALDGAESHGIQNGSFWKVELKEPNALLTSPVEVDLDAYNVPFIQLRWRREGDAPVGMTPYIEWKRKGDADWSAERRMLIFDYNSEFSEFTNFRHAIIPLHTHPEWTDTVDQIRLCLAPGEAGAIVEIDSIFSHYDTRKPYNNLLFITSAWHYFRWTGDVSFLQQEITRLRSALRFIQHEMATTEEHHVLNTWQGHEGMPGWFLGEDGEKIPNPGHGIGNNYYDLLPFGGHDMYNTAQYYGAVLNMADLEELILQNPGWALPAGGLAFDPEELRQHAAAVKSVANDIFWNPETGRFIGAIDTQGNRYDYGKTFVNLEAIWYGIANEENARTAMDWISGRRIVEGDTSQGEDIYHFRFGPRATTLRNVEWYGQSWINPETIPWGGQIQDGGAVLGMTFYDLWARLHIYGPDDTWERLQEILEWEREVREVGSYREYYAQKGITLQGGGTAGGIGIDHEFLESTLPPSIVPMGFLGLDPRGDVLYIDPKLPEAVPSMTATGILYQWVSMDVRASHEDVTVSLESDPIQPMRIRFREPHHLNEIPGREFILTEAGEYTFNRVAGE